MDDRRIVALHSGHLIYEDRGWGMEWRKRAWRVWCYNFSMNFFVGSYVSCSKSFNQSFNAIQNHHRTPTPLSCKQWAVCGRSLTRLEARLATLGRHCNKRAHLHVLKSQSETKTRPTFRRNNRSIISRFQQHECSWCKALSQGDPFTSPKST